MNRYTMQDLGTMARVVQHARYADPARYHAFIEALHRRSGVGRQAIARQIDHYLSF